MLTEPHTVSAHYLVREDGRVDSLVSLKNKAWHAGSSYWRGKEKINNNSIGIEIVNLGYQNEDDSCFELDSNKLASECFVYPFTEEQKEQVNSIINHVWSLYDIPDRNIIGHSDVGSYNGWKNDPGPAFFWSYLAENGNGIYPDVELKADPKTLYKYKECHKDVPILRQNLANYGWNVTLSGSDLNCVDTQLGYVIWSFHWHFYSSKLSRWADWDENSQMILLDILWKVGETPVEFYETSF